MQVERLGPDRSEIPAIRVDTQLFDLRPLTGDIGGLFFSSAGVALTRQAVAAGVLSVLDDTGDANGCIHRRSEDLAPSSGDPHLHLRSSTWA
jgi:hypothetical protein